jgi:hypothetical protein
LSHINCESVEALEDRQALDCPSILDPAAQKLTQHVYLLSGKKFGREGGYDGNKVGDRSGTNFLIFIVDVLAQRLDKLDQGCTATFEFLSISPLKRPWKV